ncbi:uncharacterized protein LOC129589376 [Paramacrobiotus metropolitanus]|uniref:uncharacterized protein LOC129589376 n=1 Tax=Paramacrobiotus metropolitanus TaxID=2943436 RepID=UPI0024456E6E|nr:uncharacterized protein LOC129589376 [Paramacrobiotus metropolitanus]
MIYALLLATVTAVAHGGTISTWGEILMNSSSPVPVNSATKENDYPLKPRGMDNLLMHNILRVTVSGAESLMNPCTLNDFVGDNMKKTLQKSKVKPPKQYVARNITREMLLNQVMPALKEGIDLYRSMFVLHETTNLTIFLDQNRDNMYANTVLQNYSHYYIRAGNDEMTQILFIGIVDRSEIEKDGVDLPALDFLAAQGLYKHPRQQTEFQDLHREESEMILEKRQQMAVLLSEQGTFWDDDIDYITNLLTIAFNGPETNTEFVEMLPKIMKSLNHKMQSGPDQVTEKDYDALCAQWDAENGAVKRD